MQWKSSAITIKNGMLSLANGKGHAPLIVPWAHGLPIQVEMGWDGRQYELRVTYLLTSPVPVGDGEVAGIDLGEIHPAGAHDGRQATILNGRHLRSVRRYQNKVNGRLAALRDRKTRGSRRWKRLVRSAQPSGVNESQVR